MSDSRIRTILLGCAGDGGPTDHERALAVGAAMDVFEELEKLRTLAFDLDATMRTLKMAADRDAKVKAKTIYQQMERARARSRR